MSKVRVATVDEFAAYLDVRPGRLGCWRDGTDGRYHLLHWVNVRPAIDVLELAEEVGMRTALGLRHALHHNQVGIAAGWITRHMHGPSRNVASDADRIALLKTAGDYWGLRNVLTEVRVGVRTFEMDRNIVRLPYIGNHGIDALDRIFDRLNQNDSANVPRPYPVDNSIRSWMSRHAKTHGWAEAPGIVRQAIRRLARHVLAHYDQYIEPTSRLPGFTGADYEAYSIELMARGMFMRSAIDHGVRSPHLVTPLVQRSEFVRSIAADAKIDESTGEAITEILTIDPDRCPDGALTPLFALDDHIVPMSSLILPGAPQRNLLAILQSDPNAFGQIGQLLGAAGERHTVRALDRMTSTEFATRVKVVRDNGQAAGDLDVVALDRSGPAAAAFEIKWHIGADGNAEVYRAEQLAIEKRRQVQRLRAEIESGAATPQWPAGWPAIPPSAIRWFVLTRDVLAQREIAVDGITIRSVQLIERMLRRGAVLQDLIDLLDDPPLPPAPLQDTTWMRLRYGDLAIEAEMINA